MDLAVREHDPRLARVLDRKLGLAVFPRYPPDRPAQMLAVQRLHVFDLEGLDVEIVEPQQGDGVVDVEAEREGADEVLAFLQRVGRGCVAGRAHLDGLGLDVHAHLEFEVLD